MWDVCGSTHGTRLLLDPRGIRLQKAAKTYQQLRSYSHSISNQTPVYTGFVMASKLTLTMLAMLAMLATQLKSAARNMRSAQANAEVVQKYIDVEHISSFGVIPKCQQPETNSRPFHTEWVLGYDEEQLCSLKYPSVHNGA